MNKKSICISLIVFVLAAFINLPAQAQNRKEQRDVRQFQGISFGVSGKLYIQQGKEYKLELEGDEDVLEEIETEVRDGILRIRDKRRWGWSWSTKQKITAWVTLPEVEEISVSGSGKIENESPIRADELELSVSGSGFIELDELSCDRMEVSISGSGRLALAGKQALDAMDISISGSGNVHSEDLEAEELSVSVSGSGNCYVSVSQKLRARISGSGSVYYQGRPEYVDAKTSGSGKIRSRN